MPRKNSDCSRAAYDKVMAPGARDNHYKKIILALEWIMDGTAWEIAKQARIKPDQCWKRLPELRGADTIFDTGLRRLSPDGNKAAVYALSSRRSEYDHIKPPEKFRSDEPTAADIACLIINKSENAKKYKESLLDKKLFQPDLFGEAPL